MLIYLIGAALGALAVWIAAALAFDRLGRRTQPTGTYDAIVVLGCRVADDGSPSGHLARRVEKAVELLEYGRAPVLVTTGGGRPSQADAAALHAMAFGVQEESLVLEGRSRTTRENARFSRELIEGERVLVVTDSYHVARARWIFRRHFDDVDVVGVVAPRSPRFRNALREVLAWGWNLTRALVSRRS